MWALHVLLPVLVSSSDLLTVSWPTEGGWTFFFSFFLIQRKLICTPLIFSLNQMKEFGFRWDARSPSRNRAELWCTKRNGMFLKAAVNLNTKGNREDARSHLMGISWCIFVLPSAVEAALNGKPARLQSAWAYYCTSKPFLLFSFFTLVGINTLID